MAELRLQPKQEQLLALVRNSQASWIGAGGGRGGAKSAGQDRVMLARRAELPGTVGAIVMRNFDQVQKYHISPMLRDYPELEPFYQKTDHIIKFPAGKNKPCSEIHFSYAESLADVIRRFRSASYYDIFVDQAEQFTEAELREMKQAVRHKAAPQGACKLMLAFNMGGVGIDFLRRIFHDKEWRDGERAEDFAFVHFDPWDNAQWVLPALEQDGLTQADYYGHPKANKPFTEQERMDYCAQRADYGRNLVSQDEPLRKRDWFGSWEALEGAFFARVFDRDSTVLSPEQVNELIKPWWKRWLSQDWGRGHYCPTHWHARGEISVEQAKDVLGWTVEKPVKAVLTYREYIAGGAATADEGGDRELAEQDIARQIVERTPEAERQYLRSFFLSPDAFAKRTSANTIAVELARILRAALLPSPSPADNDRIGGWALIYNLLLETRRHASQNGECLFISANCPELTRAIPLLMRDPKNLDDVLATDKGQTRIECDVSDSCRYGYKTMLSPNKKPPQIAIAEQLISMTVKGIEPSSRHITALKLTADLKKRNLPVTRSVDWRNMVGG